MGELVHVDVEVAVIGAGVVGSATALELARRGAKVALLEGEAGPALQASGTNSGILHTGFDSEPGELETELILRAALLREPVVEALAIPTRRCGATMTPIDEREREAVRALARNAEANGVEAILGEDGSLSIPGESITDPVAFTLSLAGAAERHGAELRTGFEVVALEHDEDAITLIGAGGERLHCRVAVNCAGLGAGRIARLGGDDSFDVYPRKGEFLVFDPADVGRLERILLPVPAPGTKGVLVFPTLDGKVVAGPTAVDQEDPDDWSVRPEALAELLPKAGRLYPALVGAEPIASYAGLRPAGRGVNYFIAASEACPGLVNVAAIRSTGLTASLAIAERAAELVGELGVDLGDLAELVPAGQPPVGASWWRRTAEHRAVESPTP